ncbi:MAG: hypothetical protein VYC70_08410 [Verrucomicrobiota bacterium]|nr:hypothetical protein [Verrucomicrobiota bacterium]
MDRFILGGKFIIFTIDLHLKTGLRDEVLKREVCQVSIEVERAFAFFPELELMVTRFV